jgi:hypothetical protein
LIIDTDFFSDVE